MAERYSSYLSIPRTHPKPENSSSVWSLAIKRIFDLGASLFGLAFLSPLFLAVAVLIKRDSPGPVFYKGPRIGKNNKPFLIYKFRTMHESPESYKGPRVTGEDDERVTKLGRWLRDTKINELPQLINVVRGEMSLVGPRPEDPELAETWPVIVRQEVLSVRPGLTSPASVLYRNEESMLKGERLMDTYLGAILPSKLRLDQLYVRHRSFLLDLDILFWTFLVLMPRQTDYAPAEERLFWGPLSKLVRRYVSWFSIDALVTLIAISITGVIWRSFGPLEVGWPKAILVAIGFAILFSLTGALLGANRITWSKASPIDAFDLVPPVIVATFSALIVNWFIPPHPLLPWLMVIVSATLSFMGFIIVRYRSRLLSGLALRWLTVRGRAEIAKERVLLVGGGEAGQFVAWWLQNGKSANAFRIVGSVDDDLYKQGTRIYGVHVLGCRDDIPQLVKQHDIGIIIFAIHNISEEERSQVLDICKATEAQVVVIPDILAELRSASKSNGDKTQPRKHHHNNGLGDGPSIPCGQVNNWLDQLEGIARDGDIETLKEHISKMRRQVGEN